MMDEYDLWFSRFISLIWAYLSIVDKLYKKQ